MAVQVVASAWFAVAGQGVSQVPPHPAFDANRSRWWAARLAVDPPREARLGGNDSVELGAVADFLRTQNLRDGELIAWHDSRTRCTWNSA